MAEWRVIPTLPNYEVSDEGQVRKNPKTKPSYILPAYYKAQNGQWGVTITRNYQNKFYALSRLVWRVFNGEPVPSVIGHRDGNKANNSLQNLCRGKGGRNALTPEQIEYIRATMSKPVQVVADELSIGKSTLCSYRRRIRNGEL